MVSNTGCTSVRDWLITRRMSLVAVCCSSATERSRLRAPSSVNSRTFSIAITAWSANVDSSATCASENGPGSDRPRLIAPMVRPSWTSGTASTARNPAAIAGSVVAYSASSRTSGIITVARVSTARVMPLSRLAGRGKIARIASAPSGVVLASAPMRISVPSWVATTDDAALQSRSAACAIVANTGSTEVGERLITRRISLVAVCCSSASVSARLRASSAVNSRTFSIAITAWSANADTSAIWRSVNGRTSERVSASTPTGSPSRSIGTARRVRKSASRCASANVYSVSCVTSGMWTTRLSSSARPVPEPRSGPTGTSRT